MLSHTAAKYKVESAQTDMPIGVLFVRLHSEIKKVKGDDDDEGEIRTQYALLAWILLMPVSSQWASHG